ALAEHAMDVLAVLRVVELDKHEARREPADHVGDGQVARGVAMAEVEREPELVAVLAETLDELDVARRTLDEHPGLGLERDLHALRAAAREHRTEPVAEAPPELLARALPVAPVAHRSVLCSTGPEREHRRAEIRGEIDVAQEELGSPRALGRIV